jgi:DNA-binding GntR family transcriptional regulator
MDRKPKPQPAERNSPRDAIVSALEEDIIFGRMRPRDRLVEDDLMARFEAKRHVVRQALTRLEDMGLVSRAPNRGAMVRDFSLKELDQIYEMRHLLQERAVARMTLPASAELLAALRCIHTEHAAAVEARDLPTIYRLNRNFHVTFFGACGNPQLAEAIEHYSWLSHAVRSYRMIHSDLVVEGPKEHLKMIAALESGDRASLQQLCRAHIEPSKEAYKAARVATQPKAATVD